MPVLPRFRRREEEQPQTLVISCVDVYMCVWSGYQDSPSEGLFFHRGVSAFSHHMSNQNSSWLQLCSSASAIAIYLLRVYISDSRIAPTFHSYFRCLGYTLPSSACGPCKKFQVDLLANLESWGGEERLMMGGKGEDWGKCWEEVCCVLFSRVEDDLGWRRGWRRT